MNQTALSLQPQPLRHENKLIPGREQDKNPQEQLDEVEIGNQPVEELKDAEVRVAQPCLTLCNATDCSLSGSSVHGILQARILEWVVISFSRGSSQPRDQTQVSPIVGRYFTV